MNATNATSTTGSQNVQGTWGHPADRREARLQQQCTQFEAVLTGEMLKSMRKTVPDAKGWFGESSGERTSREMFDERLSSLLSQRGSLGVGREVYAKVRYGLNADSLPRSASQSDDWPATSKKDGVTTAFTAAA